MFVVGTNDKGAVFHVPPLLTVGDQFFINFKRVLEKADFFQALGNSLFVSSMVTVSVVFFCTLAGYALPNMNSRSKTRCLCSLSPP